MPSSPLYDIVFILVFWGYLRAVETQPPTLNQQDFFLNRLFIGCKARQRGGLFYPDTLTRSKTKQTTLLFPNSAGRIG